MNVGSKFLAPTVCALLLTTAAQCAEYTVRISVRPMNRGEEKTVVDKVVNIQHGDKVTDHDLGTFQDGWYRLKATTAGPDYLSVKVYRGTAASRFADSDGRIAEVQAFGGVGGTFTFNEDRDGTHYKYKVTVMRK